MLIQNSSNPTQASIPIRTAPSSPDIVVAASPSVDVASSAAVNPVVAQKPSDAQVQRAVDSANKVMSQSNKSLEFSVDSGTKESVIKLVDTKTGDVIRQYPTEEMLAISQAIGQMQEELHQSALQQPALANAQTGSRGVLIKQQA